MAIRAVRGTVVDLTDTPIPGVPVQCALNVPTAYTSTVAVIPTPIAQVTDSSGIYYLSLYAQADLTPSGTEYVLTIGNEVHTMVVPSTAYNGSRPTYFDAVLDGLITS